MGMFSSVIDELGREWQFKTGWDDCAVYKIGDPVPYYKNEALALDSVWYDDVIDAGHWVVSGSRGLDGFVVIKSHRVHAVREWSTLGCSSELGWVYEGRHRLLPEYDIQLPVMTDWSKDAQIAYHRAQIEALERSKRW